MDTKALTTEFIGTFTLIFIGAGAGAVSGSLVAVALAHGLVVLAFAFSYGSISGTHINPAVTIGLLVGKQIEFGKAAAYIIVQLLGGIVGAAALNYVLGAKAGTLGATVPADGSGTGQAFLLELLLTFFRVNTIYFTAVSGKGGNLAPIAIGLTLVFCILMVGPLTGASLNPARTLGPALFSSAPNALSTLWIYFVACPLGGVLAALVYRGLKDD